MTIFTNRICNAYDFGFPLNRIEIFSNFYFFFRKPELYIRHALKSVAVLNEVEFRNRLKFFYASLWILAI